MYPKFYRLFLFPVQNYDNFLSNAAVKERMNVNENKIDLIVLVCLYAIEQFVIWHRTTAEKLVCRFNGAVIFCTVCRIGIEFDVNCA